MLEPPASVVLLTQFRLLWLILVAIVGDAEARRLWDELDEVVSDVEPV